jgi:hypothetical protein
MNQNTVNFKPQGVLVKGSIILINNIFAIKVDAI